MKKNKKFLIKFTKILMLVSMIFSSFLAPIEALAAGITNSDSEPAVGSIKLGIDGEISNSNSVSTEAFSLNKDISVKKTVSAIDASNGKYQVKFEIEGKENTKEKPVYVVIVFDKSGSMGGCSWGECYNMKKWNEAVTGAKTFVDTLINDKTGLKNAKIALVTFAKTATKNREFLHQELATSDFGSPNGGTNLHDGLIKAQEYFDTIPLENKDDALKYVVVMSDGKPTYYMNNGYVYEDGTKTTGDILNATFNQAKKLKDNGVTIFSLGYGINNNDVALRGNYSYGGDVYRDIKTKEILELIASDKNNYYSANNEGDIVRVFSDLAIEMITPGKNATLIDNIGSKFRIVNTNNYGGVYTGDNIEKITKDKIEYTFNIEIDPDTETGWYPTNEGFKLVYTDNDGNVKEINSDKDPYVYFKQREYRYIVNYYKDSIDDNNKLGSYSGYATNGTVIKGDSIDKNKYLSVAGEGYEFDSITPDSIKVTNDGNVKEINVLYTLKEFSYTVNYYKDNSNISFHSIKVDDVVYGTKINPSDYYLNLDDKDIINKYLLEGYKLDKVNSDKDIVTIDRDNRVINVYYVKDSFLFTVDYWFDGVKDSNLTISDSALFGNAISATDYYLEQDVLNRHGYGEYFLDYDNDFNYEKKIIGIDNSRNKLNIYYIKTNILVGGESISKNTRSEVITKSDTAIKYTVNYKTTINNVRSTDKIVVTIIDTLPYKIDVMNKNTILNGGVYDSATDTITWIKELTVSDFTRRYDVDEFIDYQVVYMDYADISASDNNKLVNVVYGNVVVGDLESSGVCDKEEIEVNILGNLIVRYVDEDGNELISNDEMIGLVGAKYKTNKKVFDKYYLSDVIGNENGEYIEGVQEVTYVYSLIPLPPQTGYDGNNINYLGLFVLGIVMLFIKKRI